jgi:hypothetical protein
MNIVVILLMVVGLLFATTYFTRRRFGVLGLALCAGFLLSTMWTADVTPLVEDAGLKLLTPPLGSVVAAALILLPAVILLFSGPVYHRHWQRLLGAVAFSLLASSFLLTPLHSGLVLDETGKKIYDFLIDNRNLIITGTIAYAVYDLLVLKTPKREKK